MGGRQSGWRTWGKGARGLKPMVMRREEQTRWAASVCIVENNV